MLSGQLALIIAAMFTGAAAAQPPLPGSGPFGPGCVVGRSLK